MLLSAGSSLEDCIKSILDCLYRGRLGPVLVVCWRTSLSEGSSSAIVSLEVSSVVRLRASSTILARVARREWGHSMGPFADMTPRAILSRRLDGGTGPLNGVNRCEGRASKVCREHVRLLHIANAYM